MAEAVKASLEFVMGPAENVHAICLDEEGISRFSEKIDAFIEEHKNENVLAFVDFMYGTPFNEFAKKAGMFEKEFELITGLNLAGLVEAVQNQTEDKSMAEVIAMIRESSAVCSLKEMLAETSDAGDDE